MQKLIILAMLAGCAPYPSVPYSEVDDAIRNAQSDEERKYYEEWRDRFERDAHRANLFFEDMNKCRSTLRETHMWACIRHYDDRYIKRNLQTIEGKVTMYRRMKTSCGCARRSELTGGRW